MRLDKTITSAVLLLTFAACVTQVGTLPIEDNEDFKSEKKVVIDDYQPHTGDSEVSCGFEEVVLQGPNGLQKKVLIPLQCEEKLVDKVCDPQETIKEEEDVVQLFDSKSESL